jgi:hypothetical protein
MPPGRPRSAGARHLSDGFSAVLRRPAREARLGTIRQSWVRDHQPLLAFLLRDALR